MFYVEVQLDTVGQLVDVKVAHQGENPTVSLLSGSLMNGFSYKADNPPIIA